MILNTELQNIAHFLLLNAEARKNIGLNGRLPLLYFFFEYAHKNKKQHYANFAFELLLEELSPIIRMKQVGKNSVTPTIETGWALMRFVEMGFFESKGLDNFLPVFDNVAIQELQRISGGTSPIRNAKSLLICALYFLDRFNFITKNEDCYLIIKEHLLISFFEITNNIKSIKTDASMSMLLRLFLEKSLDHFLIGHLVCGVFKEFNVATLSDNQNEKGLEYDALHYFCHCENEKHLETHTELIGLAIKEIGRHVKRLCGSQPKNSSFIRQKTIVFACIAVSSYERNDNLFLAYASQKLFKNYEN